MTPNRSFLFCPGNHPRKVARVFDAGADAVILDLEDAVAISEKAAARAPVAEALKAPRRCRAYVRVNALDTGFTFDDVDAVVGPGLDGIILPKVESPTDLAKVEWLIGELERRRDLLPGAVDLVPIIETGPGVANARAICAAGKAGGGRLRRVSFGAGDYTRDMGMEWTRDEIECDPARAEIVLASRIAGLEPPVDTVWVDLSDAEGLRASAEKVRRMGFQGKLCIHPSQIETVHGVFTPSSEQVAWSEKVVAAFEKAEAEGSASIQIDGQFVDYPIVARARRVLALARAIGGEA